MDEITRRVALGLAATGAVALAAVGPTEAKSLGDEIPKAFGRCLGITGGQGNFCLLFENEETGELTVFAWSGFGSGSVVRQIRRA